MSCSIHYFTILTKEYIDIINFGLQTFKKFNNIKLNVYILDESNPSLDYKNINYIHFNKKISLKNFNEKYISSHSINCAVQMLAILDKDYDIFVRIDFDSIFFCNIEELVNYSIQNNIGFLGSPEYWNDIDIPNYINCGISVINKNFLPRISFVKEFLNFYNPEIHFCPEQDFLNTFENKAGFDGMITLSSNRVDFIKTEKLKIVHLNGRFSKPFVKISVFTELLFCFIDIIFKLSKNTKFENIINKNKQFLYKEFKNLPIKKQIKILKFRSKIIGKSNLLWGL